MTVPRGIWWLLFWGVSYQARILIDGEHVLSHSGIWDAFSLNLQRWEGKNISITVEVIKNGGPTFPVRKVLSGFLPYVFNTFGGIFREVELVESLNDPIPSKPVPTRRVVVQGSELIVDGEPFKLRGVLNWGWYSETGSPHLDELGMCEEIRRVAALGLNTIKFCLYLPSHRFLELMSEAGLFAWIELPLWDPDPAILDSALIEVERIVTQYRHHSNIIAWTCGCELGRDIPWEFRRTLYELVKRITGCPLVKDNSGGSEMYLGDLREFGDFYDYHPYCDLHFYPEVLNQLVSGERKQKPILLGEFNDYDCYRDFEEIVNDVPYWASVDPTLNDQGVRWQHLLPPLVSTYDLDHHRPDLVKRSLSRACTIRRRISEMCSEFDEIAGWIVTGAVDTPISTSGVLEEGRFSPADFFEESPFRLLTARRPPWIDGGNRPGWQSRQCRYVAKALFPVRCKASSPGEFAGGFTTECGTQVRPLLDGADGDWHYGWVDLSLLPPGAHELHYKYEFGTYNESVYLFERPNQATFDRWNVSKTGFDGREASGCVALSPLSSTFSLAQRSFVQLVHWATIGKPYWRESVIDFCADRTTGPLANFLNLCQAHDLLSHDVCSAKVIDVTALAGVLPSDARLISIVERHDTRTYEVDSLLLLAEWHGGAAVVTTLRPFGGEGVQPFGLDHNPAGAAFLAACLKYLEDYSERE